jgi:hypothetical protein
VKTKRWTTGLKELTLREDGPKHFLAVYSHVQPILQQGPVCGLVALSMAGSLLGGKSVDVDMILAEAGRRGYSRRGEMFSVDHMKELALHFYPDCEYRVLRTTEAQDVWGTLVSCLVDGGVLLFPYDADFNHGPAERKGHAAHWAVVHGILGAFGKDDWSMNFGNEETISCEFGSITISSPANITQKGRRDVKELFFNENTFVICHQGKSTHTGIWRLEDLLRSNHNLREIAPKLLIERDSMILCDIETGLRNQAIMIKKLETLYAS